MLALPFNKRLSKLVINLVQNMTLARYKRIGIVTCGKGREWGTIFINGNSIYHYATELSEKKLAVKIGNSVFPAKLSMSTKNRHATVETVIVIILSDDLEITISEVETDKKIVLFAV